MSSPSLHPRTNRASHEDRNRPRPVKACAATLVSCACGRSSCNYERRHPKVCVVALNNSCRNAYATFSIIITSLFALCFIRISELLVRLRLDGAEADAEELQGAEAAGERATSVLRRLPRTWTPRWRWVKHRYHFHAHQFLHSYRRMIGLHWKCRCACCNHRYVDTPRALTLRSLDAARHGHGRFRMFFFCVTAFSTFPPPRRS